MGKNNFNIMSFNCVLYSQFQVIETLHRLISKSLMSDLLKLQFFLPFHSDPASFSIFSDFSLTCLFTCHLFRDNPTSCNHMEREKKIVRNVAIQLTSFKIKEILKIVLGQNYIDSYIFEVSYISIFTQFYIIVLSSLQRL